MEDEKYYSSVNAGARAASSDKEEEIINKLNEKIKELDQTIDRNWQAQKLYGGGDTLQEFKNLSPGLYLAAMDDAKYYFFTGGGTVLKAIEEGSPYGLEPVKALMENAANLART